MGFSRLIKVFTAATSVLGICAMPVMAQSPTTTPTTTIRNDYEITGNTWCDGNLRVAGSTTFAGGTSYSGPITGPSIILTGTSFNGTLQVPPSLGQATTFALPDAGNATDTVATLRANNTFLGTNKFPISGIVLSGTSFNDTLKALAAQGQATALTLDDPGNAVGYVYTMLAAQTAPGVLSRADMVTETGDKVFRSLLGVRNLDGSVLAASAASGKFGITTTASFGSPVNLLLTSETATSNTKTDVCEFEYMLPPDYVAGSAITVNISSNVTGGGTLTTNSLTVDAFLVAAAGTVGTNLGPGAGTLTQGAVNNQGFSITPAGLVAGNKLLIQIQTAITESTGGTINANITDINIATNVKM